MPALSLSWDVPPIKKDCDTCHISQAMGVSLTLKAPLSELCINCHPDRVSPAEHKIDIAPTMMPINALPLDEEGRMTCITCHDPHGTTRIVKMLRTEHDKLCRYCHKM